MTCGTAGPLQAGQSAVQIIGQGDHRRIPAIGRAAARTMPAP